MSPSGAVPIRSCACALVRGFSKDSSAGQVSEPGRWSAALAGLGEADMMSAGSRTAVTSRRDDGRPAGQGQWLTQCPVQVSGAAPFAHRAAQKDP